MSGVLQAPTVRLECHPSARSGAVHGIEVRVRRPAAGELALRFRLEGDVARIEVPSSRRPRMASELWRHTCFEAFIAGEGRPAYHELNFSPSGEWTVHAFRAYREGGPLEDESLAPEVAVRIGTGRLELDAVVALERLSTSYPSARLCLGLAAVIEAGDGALSYWALRHPAGAPDFHHSDAFALRLEPPDAR